MADWGQLQIRRGSLCPEGSRGSNPLWENSHYGCVYRLGILLSAVFWTPPKSLRLASMIYKHNRNPNSCSLKGPTKRQPSGILLAGALLFGVLFVGAPTTRALLLGACILAGDFWKRPYQYPTQHTRLGTPRSEATWRSRIQSPWNLVISFDMVQPSKQR